MDASTLVFKCRVLAVKITSETMLWNAQEKRQGSHLKRHICVTYIGNKYSGSQSSCLKAIYDLMWDVGVVGNGRRKVHHSWTAVSTPSSWVHSSTALQHPPCMLSIGILKQWSSITEVRILSRKTLFLYQEIDQGLLATSLILSGLPLRSCLFMTSMAFFTNSSSLNSTTLWGDTWRLNHCI